MLRLEAVRKSFFDPGRGAVPAVDGIDLELEAGVVALMGANGAGKSTLLRLIATLLQADTGRVLLSGTDIAVEPQSVRARLGYLSTTTRLYPRFTARELLAHVAGLFPLSPSQQRERQAAMVSAFALDAFLDQRIQGLSTGQLQRLNLARTLLPDPDLLVLDEPTTGLDLVAADQLVAAIRAARRPGRLIILATHVAREAELLADRLVLLRRGRVAFADVPAALGSGEAFARAVLDQLAEAA